MTETFTANIELSAARMDMWCATSILNNVAYWMRVMAGVPQAAPVEHAYMLLERRAAQGDKSARRKVPEFEQAATGYEGARVALAELLNAEPAADDAAIALTGDDARAMREAMAR